jgi:FtsP/CotA-like multicopper oxidase with cupredoxin domain
MREQADAPRRGRNAIVPRTKRLGLVVALVAGLAALAQGHSGALPAGAPRIGMVCTPGTLSGATRTFNVLTNTGYIDTPDGNSVFMWSYANHDAPDNDHFQEPGPVLCAVQGETVVVNLANTLPEPSSILFPGQEGVTATGGAPGLLTTEASAAGGAVSYRFVAGSPGTYLYESGSDPSKQVEMGLYGALVIRPNTTTCPALAGTNCAYDTTTRFDLSREFLLLLSDIDPDLHHAVETNTVYDFNALRSRYFSINGRSFPDTIQDNGTSLQPNQPYGSLVRIQPNSGTNVRPALLRMINVGTANHPFHPHGNHTREIAQDGRPILGPDGAPATTEHFGETIGSGQTQDYLLKWDPEAMDTSGANFHDNWDPNKNPLPVGPPNYRNVFFKDGNTWYGGSPYLGYKGTLPTGTTSQNVCGEWYFPLHSHALNEFSNFDAGFGGMGTLLRVDPQGGCFAFPTSTRISAGTLNSGSVTNLAVQNDSKAFKVNSTTAGTRTSDWYAQFSGVAAGATNLKITYKGNNSISVTQRLYVWNWVTTAWDLIAGPQTVGSADVTVPNLPVPATGLGTGPNNGLVRIRVSTTGAGTNFITAGDFMALVYDAP